MILLTEGVRKMNDKERTMSETPQGAASEFNDGLDVDMCRCGKNPAQNPHSCPYVEEIGDNHGGEYCICCDDCRHECAMDI